MKIFITFYADFLNNHQKAVHMRMLLGLFNTSNNDSSSRSEQLARNLHDLKVLTHGAALAGDHPAHTFTVEEIRCYLIQSVNYFGKLKL